MVIEDDPDIRELLEETLDLEGFPTTSARNGAEAMESLRSQPPPRVIVLDLMMPKMNGWEFLESKRSLPELKPIPVIILSAVGSDHIDETLADEVISKPIDLRVLIEAVRRRCD
jgi:CheY-like chemotaxis protein